MSDDSPKILLAEFCPLKLYTTIDQVFIDLFGQLDQREKDLLPKGTVIEDNKKELFDWLMAVSVYLKNILSVEVPESNTFKDQELAIANMYPGVLESLFFLYRHSKNPESARGLFDAGKEYYLRIKVREEISYIQDQVDGFYKSFMMDNPGTIIPFDSSS